MTPTFPADYPSARHLFRTAATTAGARCRAYAVPAPVTDLTIDTAEVGPPGAGAVVVVTSGLHGVEGLFGSAVQLAWLTQKAAFWSSEKTRLVLVHALNPFGFAYLRRTDVDNIDLNRNFLPPDEAYTGSPAYYPRLDRFLNPVTPTPRVDAFQARAAWVCLRYGFDTLRQTLPVGQYDYPAGLYFGGQQPAGSRAAIENVLRDAIAGAHKVIILDLHTGLGRFGECTLLTTSPVDTPIWARLLSVAGPLQLEKLGFGVAAASRGTLGNWLVDRYANQEVAYAAAEFGTYSAIRVLGAMRAENRAHFYDRPYGRAYRQAKAEFREAFCPASDRWRASVVATAMSLVSRSIQLHSG